MNMVFLLSPAFSPLFFSPLFSSFVLSFPPLSSPLSSPSPLPLLFLSSPLPPLSSSHLTSEYPPDGDPQER